MTPPTTEQITALEQWAREAKKWEMVRTDEWPDAILALCETVRAQGAALRDGVRENWAMQQERDAAVARAEQAERERDEWKARAEAIVIPTADAYETQVAALKVALTEARRVLREASEWLEPEISRGPANPQWVQMMRNVAAVLAQEEEA